MYIHWIDLEHCQHCGICKKMSLLKIWSHCIAPPPNPAPPSPHKSNLTYEISKRWFVSFSKTTKWSYGALNCGPAMKKPEELQWHYISSWRNQVTNSSSSISPTLETQGWLVAVTSHTKKLNQEAQWRNECLQEGCYFPWEAILTRLVQKPFGILVSDWAQNSWHCIFCLKSPSLIRTR